MPTVNTLKNPFADAKARPTSVRESADDYHRVIARLSDRWRVIVCRDAIQWIAQRRVNSGRRGGEWKAVHYCRTREALLRLCDASCKRMDPAAWASLLALPDVIGETPE